MTEVRLFLASLLVKAVKWKVWIEMSMDKKMDKGTEIAGWLHVIM